MPNGQLIAGAYRRCVARQGERGWIRRRALCLRPQHSRSSKGRSRPMNIHEYQAKELLAKFGVPVPAGFAALSVEEAVEAAKKLPGPLYVVKAQIHAGGRGKGKFKELGPDAKGGVRLAKTLDEVRAAATDMLGNTLVTIQTGEHGKQVNRLYVTDGVDIAKEFYLALLVNRATGRIVDGRLDRGRHGHRGRRARHAREDPHDRHRPGDRLHAASRPRRRRRARA